MYTYVYVITYIYMCLCVCGSAGKESACNEGDVGSIPGLGRFRGEGNSYPLQYSGLENSMDFIVHGVAESDRQPLSLSCMYLFFNLQVIMYTHIHIFRFLWRT